MINLLYYIRRARIEKNCHGEKETPGTRKKHSVYVGSRHFPFSQPTSNHLVEEKKFSSFLFHQAAKALSQHLVRVADKKEGVLVRLAHDGL